MQKKALIIGLTGQDGSYLAEFLINKGYRVYGMYRRTSIDVFERISHLKDKVTLVEGDLTDLSSMIKILQNVRPDEVYNLGAQSFVPSSWTQPISTAEITAIGVIKILEAIKIIDRGIRFYQASSSEMFGKAVEFPQSETTVFHPRSPYAISKVFAYYTTINYRESYGLFACSGILFNHESPRRGKQFVTRKITHSVAEIALGIQKYPLELGNLDAKRDWGYAGDYVEAMWLMLQQEHPENYVIATNNSYSVREFVTLAFECAGMKIEWEGEGLNEVGKVNGEIWVKVNPKFYRPAEVDHLRGDYSKAEKILGWKPKTNLKELIEMMFKSDLEKLSAMVKSDSKKEMPKFDKL